MGKGQGQGQAIEFLEKYLRAPTDPDRKDIAQQCVNSLNELVGIIFCSDQNGLHSSAKVFGLFGQLFNSDFESDSQLNAF